MASLARDRTNLHAISHDQDLAAIFAGVKRCYVPNISNRRESIIYLSKIEAKMSLRIGFQLEIPYCNFLVITRGCEFETDLPRSRVRTVEKAKTRNSSSVR